MENKRKGWNPLEKLRHLTFVFHILGFVLCKNVHTSVLFPVYVRRGGRWQRQGANYGHDGHSHSQSQEQVRTKYNQLLKIENRQFTYIASSFLSMLGI